MHSKARKANGVVRLRTCSAVDSEYSSPAWYASDASSNDAEDASMRIISVSLLPSVPPPTAPVSAEAKPRVADACASERSATDVPAM